MSIGLDAHNKKVLKTTAVEDMQVLLRQRNDETTVTVGFFPRKGKVCVKRVPDPSTRYAPYFQPYSGDHKKTVVVTNEGGRRVMDLLGHEETDRLINLGMIVPDADGDLMFRSHEPQGGDLPWLIIKTSIGLVFTRRDFGWRHPITCIAYEHKQKKSKRDALIELSKLMYEEQRELTELELRNARYEVGYFNVDINFSDNIKKTYESHIDCDYVTGHPDTFVFRIKIESEKRFLASDA